MRRFAAILLVFTLATPMHQASAAWSFRGAKKASVAQKTSKAHPDLELALEHKALWHDRDKLHDTGLSRTQIGARIDAVETRLRAARVYAVDAQKGKRVLQSPSTIALSAEVLDSELGKLLPPDILPEVRVFVSRALGKVKGKSLYARPGLHAIADLLEDGFVIEHIAKNPTQVVKLTIAIEAVRQVAARHSMSYDEATSLELKYVFKKDPALRKLVEEARANGVEVALRREDATSPEVLLAIKRISVLSQELYVQTWLPQLVKEGKLPVLTVGKNGRARGVGRKLITEEATDEEIVAQLQKDVATIQAGAKQMMGFVTKSASGRHAELEVRLDQPLEDLRADHAVARMSFDNADANSAGAKEIMSKMMWVGPCTHLFEMLNLGGVAAAFAGSADDVGNYWAERTALKEAGYTNKELMKQARVLLPVFGLATYGAFQVDDLLAAGHEGEAGLLFGVTATALSLATSVLSMSMYKAGYDQLLKEGKVPGKAKHLAGSPRFQEMLKELDRSAKLLTEQGKPELLALVRRHLDEIGDAIGAEEKKLLLDTLAGLDWKALEAQLRDPTKLERWKAGIKQDFSNPTRLGILTGTALAPFIALAAAKAGIMTNGFAMAFVGSSESIVGGIMVKLSHRLNEYKMRLALKNKIEALASN